MDNLKAIRDQIQSLQKLYCDYLALSVTPPWKSHEIPSLEDSIRTDVVNPKDWEKNSDGVLFVSPNRNAVAAYDTYDTLATLSNWVSYKFTYTTTSALSYPEQTPIDEPMEVNLTETLTGFRSWVLKDGVLESLYTHHAEKAKWFPMTPHIASCPNKCCVECPTTGHSCGIYAADKLNVVPKSVSNDDEERMDVVIGLVHGWGRYVRGDSGWRAQYAYPKEFRLREDQVELIDALKAYQVPIFIQQPLKIYDPEEEGYANGNDKENWNF